MENLQFSLSVAFREVVDRMESEGAFDHEAYLSFIDEVLEERMADAELDPDANIKEYAEKLQLMWPQAEALLTKTGEEGDRYLVGDENEAEIPDQPNEKPDA